MSKTKWTREAFLDYAERRLAPELIAAHKTVLQAVDLSDLITPSFVGNGAEPTYHICFRSDPKLNFVWIYASGKVYARWRLLREKFGQDLADHFVTGLQGQLKDSDIHSGFGDGGELNFRLSEHSIPRLLARLEELVRRTRDETS